MKRMKEGKKGSVHPSETGLYLFHTIFYFSNKEQPRGDSVPAAKPTETNENQ